MPGCFCYWPLGCRISPQIKKSCIVVVVVVVVIIIINICFCVSVDSKFYLKNKEYFLTGFPVPNEKTRMKPKCTFLFLEKWIVTGLYLLLVCNTRERQRILPHSNSLKLKLQLRLISSIMTAKLAKSGAPICTRVFSFNTVGSSGCSRCVCVSVSVSVDNE